MQDRKYTSRYPLHLLHLVLFPEVHVSTHIPVVSFCPAAHTAEWSDDRLSQLRQGILDRDGLRSRHAPRDQSGGFEIAKSSGKHPLGDASEVSAQLAVSMRSLLQRKQDLGGPSADKNRGGHFRSLHRIHSVAFCETSQRSNLPHTFSSAVRHGLSLPARARSTQLGTRVYLSRINWRALPRFETAGQSRMDASEQSGLNSYRGPVWPVRIR